MRGPWSHARPVSAAQLRAAEMYIKRADLAGILEFMARCPSAAPLGLLAARALQVVEMGGTLTIIEDTAKARSGDAPYR